MKAQLQVIFIAVLSLGADAPAAVLSTNDATLAKLAAKGRLPAGLLPRIRTVEAGRRGFAGREIAAPASAFGFLPLATQAVTRTKGARMTKALASPGGVALDSTLGQTAQPIISTNAHGQNDFALPAESGLRQGGNLFYSFSSFNLATNESATFRAPVAGAPVQNVLARVNGGPSSIDGTVRNLNPGANLFLLNPAGVLFGPNARLDLSGSLIVSTGDFLQLVDGVRFTALPGSTDAALTSATVSGFGFTAPHPAAITAQGSLLAVPAGATLSFVGGDLQFSGAQLSAPGGRVNLLSVGGPGGFQGDPLALTGDFAAQGFARLGQVTFAGTTLGADAASGGRISVQADSLALTDSTFTARTLGRGTGGGIDIALRGGLTSTNSLLDTHAVAASGETADLTVEVAIDHPFVSDLDVALISPTGTRVSLIAPIGGGADIAHTTFDDRAVLPIAGAFSPFAGVYRPKMPLAAVEGQTADGIWTLQITDKSPGDVGVLKSWALDLGGVTYTAANLPLALADNATSVSLISIATPGLNVGTSPATAGGQNAGSVVIAAHGAVYLTGSRIDSSGLGDGKNGALRLSAGSVSLDQSVLDASAVGGTGGQLSVRATGAILVDHDSAIHADNLSAQTGPRISLKAASLTVKSGSFIGDEVFGSGRGSALTVNAGHVLLDGQGSASFTGLRSFVATSGTGAGGRVALATGGLQIRRGGVILADTDGPGRGSNLYLFAQSALLDSDAVAFFDGIAARTGGPGEAGNVSLTVGDLVILDEAKISAETVSNEKARGGDITIIANTVSLDQRPGGISDVPVLGGIDAKTLSTGAGGRIDLTANSLHVGGGLDISCSSGATGNAGSIRITAGKIDLADEGEIIASAGTGGNGGGIVITTQNLLLRSGGSLVAETSSEGIGGDIAITARRIRITGLDSGIFTDTTSDRPQDHGGDIQITIGESMTLAGGGTVDASTGGAGAGGDITIRGRDLTLFGNEGLSTVGIDASSSGPDHPGRGGAIRIDLSGRLQMGGGALVSANTSSTAAGGTISISAGSIELRGAGTAVSTTTSGRLAGGPAGGIQLSADSLSLTRGARVDSSSEGAGRGGAIEIQAGTLSVQDLGSEIAAGANGLPASGFLSGDGGSIRVQAQNVEVSEGGRITASTLGSGLGGGIEVRAAGDFVLHSGGSITSSSTGSGAAGDVAIVAAGRIDMLGGSTIAATATNSLAGQITLQAGTILRLVQSGVTVLSSRASAGSIVLRAGHILELEQSQIVAEAALDGGSILIDPSFAILRGTLISANAGGVGGNINIQSDFFFRSESLLTATGATAGTIQITAPDLQLTNGLIQLPAGLLDASTQLREQCARRLGQDFSSFLLLGDGGTAESPDEEMSSGVR